MQSATFAIADTKCNYALAKGRVLREKGQQYGLGELLVDDKYTKGIYGPAHQEYMMGQGGDDMRRKFATLAVIKIFTRQVQEVQDVVQSLQGAQYWDGNDLFHRFKSHFRSLYGLELSNPQQGLIYQNVSVIRGTQAITSSPASKPKISAKRQYTYLPTMTAGGTIFFKIHPQAAAQGIKF